MEKLLIGLMIFALFGCATGLEQQAGPPGIPPPPAGTAAELTTGTETKTRVWSPSILATQFSGAAVEVQNEAFTAANASGDTTHAPSQDSIHDWAVVIDVGLDGDVDVFDATALAAAETDPLALLTAGTDNVKDTHIDWGAGAGQVNSADIGAEPALGNPATTGFILSSTDAGVRSWVAAGAGDVSGVGDCTGGACLDGTDDGGTNVAFYDGDSNKTVLQAGNSIIDLVFTFPTAYPAGNDALVVSSTAGALSTVASTNYLATAGTDNVKDTHIDWGSGAGQVNSADIGAEPALGNPATTGFVLTSTDAGVRSWAAAGAEAPTNVTPVDAAEENATFYPILVDGATGSQATETDAGISYNPSTNVLTVGGLSVPATATGPQVTTLLEDSDNGSNYLGWGSPATNANDLILLLPVADPTAGQVLSFAVPEAVTFNDGVARDAAAGSWITHGLPASADGAALGSATLEWSDLFLADGGVIYGQNDQSATLTSSASLWTANNFAIDTQFKLPSSNADPTATAGYIRHDSTISNFTNGGLTYHNGAAIKQLVDMTTATASACTDDQIVAYDADSDLWYCKDDSTGAGSLGANLSSTTNDITSDNNAVQFVANSEDLVLTATANTWTLSTTTSVDTLNFSAIGLLTTGAIGSTAAEVADVYLADGGIVYLGNDQDVTLTHVADTGVLLNAAMQLQFRDSALHIASADDGHLDITADTSIDLNGAVIASSTIAATGAVSGNNVNPDAADGATLGTTALEWSDLYMADGGVIYFQNDQSVYLTPSAGVLTLTGRFVSSGIQSLTPVIDDPDNFAANFTGANLYGGTFIANAAGTAALPDPAVGMNFTYVLEGANANIVDPLDTGTADTITMNGLAAASDENITSSTSGAMCVFQYRAANSWMATCNGFAEATPP